MVMKSIRRPDGVRKSDHQPEEIGIGLRVRAAEAGRDPADADVRRRRWVAREDAEPVELLRQFVGERQQDLRPRQLLLVGAAVRSRELLVIGDEGLLHAGNFSGEIVEIRRSSGEGRNDVGIGASDRRSSAELGSGGRVSMASCRWRGCPSSSSRRDGSRVETQLVERINRR